MIQHEGLAIWTLPGTKPKWLFCEAAVLEAHSSSTKRQEHSIIFRWGWKDYTTLQIEFNK